MNTRMKVFGVAAVAVLTGCVADASENETESSVRPETTAVVPATITRGTVPSEIRVQLCDDESGFDATYGSAIADALGEKAAREIAGGLATEITLPGFDPAAAKDPSFMSVKLANADGSPATGPVRTIGCSSPAGEADYRVEITALDGSPVAAWPSKVEIGALKAGFEQDGTRTVGELTFVVDEREGAALEGAVGRDVTARIDRLPRKLSASPTGGVASASWTMEMTITESTLIAKRDGTSVRKVSGGKKYNNIVLKRGADTNR